MLGDRGNLWEGRGAGRLEFECEVGFDFARWVVGAHERLADEHGVGTGFEHAEGVGGGFDAAFGDEEDVVWDFLGEAGGGFEVDFEGFEVAVVYADEVGTEFERSFHFAEVVDFDEHVELAEQCLFVEVAEGGVVERGDDEEDGIGAADGGLVDLHFVDGEILAEQGRVGKPGDRGEV